MNLWMQHFQEGLSMQINQIKSMKMENKVKIKIKLKSKIILLC